MNSKQKKTHAGRTRLADSIQDQAMQIARLGGDPSRLFAAAAALRKA